MKIYHIAITTLTLIISSYSIKVEAQNLPYCQESVCEKIFHNKQLEKATLVIWQGKDSILHSHTFELEKTAKLIAKTNEESGFTIQTDPPAPPSSNGGSSVPVSTVYETPTEIITITITYIYYNGVLVDIETTETRTPKPDDTQIEQ